MFTSSAAAYKPTDEILAENGELQPVNDYGRSKLQAEKGVSEVGRK